MPLVLGYFVEDGFERQASRLTIQNLNTQNLNLKSARPDQQKADQQKATRQLDGLLTASSLVTQFLEVTPLDLLF
jgi:hypothetical protein